MSDKARTGALSFNAVDKAWAAALRKAGWGDDRRDSASFRVRFSFPTLARSRVKVSSNRRVHCWTAGMRSSISRSRSALSSCGREARMRRSHGRQRVALGWTFSACSISQSSSLLSSSDRNRLSAETMAAWVWRSEASFEMRMSSRAMVLERVA